VVDYMNSKFKFRRECLDRLKRYKRANIYYQDKENIKLDFYLYQR